MEEEQEYLFFFFFEMMDPSHIEAIEREYKQIEDNEAWSQVYQVWYNDEWLACFEEETRRGDSRS